MRPALLLASACLAASTLLTVTGCNRSSASEEKAEATESMPDTDQAKAAGVHLDRDRQKRMGLVIKALKSSTYRPRVELYGALESDPAEVFVVRAPVAGKLQANDGGWPLLGSHLKDRASVASIMPQLTGADQVTLADRLSTIRAAVDTDTASLAASTAEYQRLKILNAEDKNASDKALQEAEVRMKGDQAQLDAARRSEELVESALHGAATGYFVTPLIAERGGDVSEVLAQPGETVGAGQPIFRIDRFSSLIARLNLPLSQSLALPITDAFISLVGEGGNPIPATFVAEAPSVQPEYQSEALLFRVTSRNGALRPGQAVQGWIPTKGTSRQSGVLIPFDAVVRYRGQNWVYVQVSDTDFVRKPLTLSEPESDGWFVTAGFHGGDRIAVVGAETLLSEENKSQLSSDEN